MTVPSSCQREVAAIALVHQRLALKRQCAIL